MIDLRYVKKLIEMIDESTVDSIEITSDKGMKIRISKSPQQRGAVQVAAPVPMPAMVPAAARPADSPAQGHPGRRRRSAAPAEPPKATAARGEVADGRHVLHVAGAGREAVRRGGRPRREGADPLHHRGDEDHERDRVRVLAASCAKCSCRTRNRSNTGRSSSGSTQWLTPPADGATRRSRRQPGADAASISRRCCRDDPAERSDLHLKVGRPPMLRVERRARCRSSCRRSSPKT